CRCKKGKVAGFYSARSETIPPLTWPNFAPPFPPRKLAPRRRFHQADIAVKPSALIMLSLRKED
ncbi:MAG: hypothetical protein ACN4E6_12375, partial [Qipengyuania pacifica]